MVVPAFNWNATADHVYWDHFCSVVKVKEEQVLSLRLNEQNWSERTRTTVTSNFEVDQMLTDKTWMLSKLWEILNFLT